MSEVMERVESTQHLVEIETLKPSDVFVPGKAEAIVERVEKQVRAVKPDLSTAKGRKAIASLSRRVSSSKVALDDMGKVLTDEIAKQAKDIHAQRKLICDRFDALRDEVRAPLSAWEEAEADRKREHQDALDAITEGPTYGLVETSAEIQTRLDLLLNYPERNWEDYWEWAKVALSKEIERTRGLLAGAEKREADAAELEKLRAQAAERDRAEAERRAAQEAAEAAEAALRAAEQAEREKAAWEGHIAAEATRKAEEAARAAQEAAERRAREAEEAAAQAERDRIAAVEKAKEDARKAASLAALKAERDRDDAIRFERNRVEAERVRQEEEDRRRTADKAHRATVNRAILDRMVGLGVSEEVGKLVIGAIVLGAIPHLTISY